MQRMKYYLVDAFAEKQFEGNQAGVCLVDKPLDTETMFAIARENNLSETAFVEKVAQDSLDQQIEYDTVDEGLYSLRWFSPTVEIDLCGHATLASAFVLFNYVDTTLTTLRFDTVSGRLTVRKKAGLYELDFPSRPPVKISPTIQMEEALGAPVKEAYLARDLILLVDDEQTVQSLQPDIDKIAQLPDCFAVAVTAKGTEVDFVSRFFAPNAGAPEDPVTGSSHTSLVPFWAPRLGKSEMIARQLSKRGGTLYCEDCGDRIRIAGSAALYLSGEIHIDPEPPSR